ncbi:hypothetical protein L1987_53224 [Smallanthus sonchifolius]|uniref:Uncharacterized protein n=1 Tax=Smallanthus sonchifolius TaxID=185202 RepID=A0ACB9EW36_9ASTR|nr:hypothetical protein L1987_53224 [Smallanthus sonchifolius]
MKSKFEMSNMGELSFFLGLQVSQRKDGIYLHQTKYVQDILLKYKMNDSSTFGTSIPVNHGLHPDKAGKDVDCKLYRGMIGSLMYLTASRPDIMFVGNPVWVFGTQSSSHLTSKPILILTMAVVTLIENQLQVDVNSWETGWSPGSARSSQRFLSQHVKQSTLRDYGLNFTGTPLFIDNNATMSITNNPVKHSKTKHIEIRHHFIRDCAEKHLIELVKVHTDDNFADLFTKAFDRTRFEHLVNMIGMFNPE